MQKVTQHSLLLFCCIIVIQLQALGQNSSGSVTLTGKVEAVVDTSGLFYSPPNKIKNDPYALPGATVILMSLDSTFIAGSTTGQKNGRFRIDGLTPGHYIVRTSLITYETRYQPLTITKSDSQFIEITLGTIYDPSDLPFNGKNAISDLNSGIIKLKIWGEVIGGKHPFDDPDRQEKFGYDIEYVYKKYEGVFDLQWERLRQATIRYNQIVDEYLSDEYGEKWDGLSTYW